MVSQHNTVRIITDGGASDGGFLGIFATAPVTAIEGDTYQNSGTGDLYYYDGASWVLIPLASSGDGGFLGTFTTAPSIAIAGDQYYNTTDNTHYYYNGSTWLPIPASGGDGGFKGLLSTAPATAIEGDTYYDTTTLAQYGYIGGAWVEIPSCCESCEFYDVAPSFQTDVSAYGKYTSTANAVTNDYSLVVTPDQNPLVPETSPLDRESVTSYYNHMSTYPMTSDNFDTLGDVMSLPQGSSTVCTKFAKNCIDTAVMTASHSRAVRVTVSFGSASTVPGFVPVASLRNGRVLGYTVSGNTMTIKLISISGAGAHSVSSTNHSILGTINAISFVNVCYGETHSMAVFQIRTSISALSFLFVKIDDMGAGSMVLGTISNAPVTGSTLVGEMKYLWNTNYIWFQYHCTNVTPGLIVHGMYNGASMSQVGSWQTYTTTPVIPPNPTGYQIQQLSPKEIVDQSSSSFFNTSTGVITVTNQIACRGFNVDTSDYHFMRSNAFSNYLDPSESGIPILESFVPYGPAYTNPTFQVFDHYVTSSGGEYSQRHFRSQHYRNQVLYTLPIAASATPRYVSMNYNGFILVVSGIVPVSGPIVDSSVIVSTSAVSPDIKIENIEVGTLGISDKSENSVSNPGNSATDVCVTLSNNSTIVTNILPPDIKINNTY